MIIFDHFAYLSVDRTLLLLFKVVQKYGDYIKDQKLRPLLFAVMTNPIEVEFLNSIKCHDNERVKSILTNVSHRQAVHKSSRADEVEATFAKLGIPSTPKELINSPCMRNRKKKISLPHFKQNNSMHSNAHRKYSELNENMVNHPSFVPQSILKYKKDQKISAVSAPFWVNNAGSAAEAAKRIAASNHQLIRTRKSAPNAMSGHKVLACPQESLPPLFIKEETTNTSSSTVNEKLKLDSMAEVALRKQSKTDHPNFDELSKASKSLDNVGQTREDFYISFNHNCRDEKDMNGLQIALYYDNFEVLKLLAYNPKVEVNDIVYHAIDLCNYDVLEFLLSIDRVHFYCKTHPEITLDHNSTFNTNMNLVMLAAIKNDYTSLSILHSFNFTLLIPSILKNNESFSVSTFRNKEIYQTKRWKSETGLTTCFELAKTRSNFTKAKCSIARIVLESENGTLQDPLRFVMKQITKLNMVINDNHEDTSDYEKIRAELFDFLKSELDLVTSSEELADLLEYPLLNKCKEDETELTTFKLGLIQTACENRLESFVSHWSVQMALSRLKRTYLCTASHLPKKTVFLGMDFTSQGYMGGMRLVAYLTNTTIFA